MVITTFNGTGVGFGTLVWVSRFLHIRNLDSLSHAKFSFSGFGVGCGFGIGWGFGGLCLTFESFLTFLYLLQFNFSTQF